MSVYFGTDGIRGEVNRDLTNEICYKCGNALSAITNNANILIGRDTRTSGEFVTLAFSVGALIGGGSVIDVGIIPTAGIAYLLCKYNCDYGVVISASHNPPKDNGIKIFDKFGNKIDALTENLLERQFVKNNIVYGEYVGSYCQKQHYTRQYIKYLRQCVDSLCGLKIALDCSNGASYYIAPSVFKQSGAKIIKKACTNNGRHINDNCGALYPEKLAEIVVRNNCDMGFAFDGDSDRVIAIDEKGNIIDGDKITYILANYYKSINQLQNNGVVGTTQTNSGIINKLKENDIDFYVSDVGDKYVNEMMNNNKLQLGGEQSGHIIIGKYATTGDGILAGLVLADIVAKSGEKLSKLSQIELYPQVVESITVCDKLRILNSDKLNHLIKECEYEIPNGRIIVRASGTENKIRILVEDKNIKLCGSILKTLCDKVKEIDEG